MESKINSKQYTFHFFALAAVGEGLSGGDRIFIEFARRWAKWGHEIHIYLWQEGYNITQAQKLRHSRIHFHIVNLGYWPRLGFVINYLARIFAGIKLGLTLDVGKSDYLYSCSDFLMDSLPAWLLKLCHPGSTWCAGWYQTAPNPLKGYAEGARKQTYRATALLYWLSQAAAKPLVSHWADFILVNNENEKAAFPRAVVVLGAVDIVYSLAYIKSHPRVKKAYNALFMGRFHPQKGVLEMIDIWSKVTKIFPDAKLGMIGDGELMSAVKLKIRQLNLEKNITLFGYIYDGPRKYRIFSQGKLVVHPAFYDSGGMFAAEAMAFGLPAVGFNLASYASYYPQGMLKVPVGDLDAMAQAILKLLKDYSARIKLGQQAKDMVVNNWSWDSRATQVFQTIVHE